MVSTAGNKGRTLTRTVVSLRSVLAPVHCPPVKVVRAVLGKLAGRLPLVVFHVEITSAWQGEDVLCEGRKGRSLLFLLSDNSLGSSPKLVPVPAHHSRPHQTRRRSHPYGHTSGGTGNSDPRDT